MKWGRHWLAAWGTLIFSTCVAWADDRPFVFAYTTDIEAQYEKEIEQELTWASGHSKEPFQAIESRSELEYGFTDDLQGAFYLNYDWSRIRPPSESATISSLPRISGEFIYRFLNVDFDAIGL